MKNSHCQYKTEDVGRYLLNQMTLDEETQFQEHILSCSICSTKVKDIQSLCKAFKEDDNDCIKHNINKLFHKNTK